MNDRRTHMSEAELVQLARSGGTHPHCDVCAFCREQLAQLRAMRDHVDAAGEADGATLMQFRLAAQGAPQVTEDTRWRQTWYLEDGAVVLRVVEDRREQMLTGFLLCAPERLETARVRFSGIAESFRPDSEGRFTIGPSSIDIEPMSVQLE
jgi:hypothetical protein